MKKTKTSPAPKSASPSRLIDARIKELEGWRGTLLAQVRALIKQADPDVTEEWKWSVPVWSHDGLICTGEAYKDKVKLTFAKGAQLRDPKKLFNSSLEGNVRRAIDFFKGDTVDEPALRALIRAAVALNTPRKAASETVATTFAERISREILRLAKEKPRPCIVGFSIIDDGWETYLWTRYGPSLERHIDISDFDQETRVCDWLTCFPDTQSPNYDSGKKVYKKVLTIIRAKLRQFSKKPPFRIVHVYGDGCEMDDFKMR